MNVRFSSDPNLYRTMTQGELRASFLIDSLFTPDNIPLVYSDVDRSIIGSAVPVSGQLQLLSSKKEMAAEYFTERREIGIINIGDEGIVTTDGEQHELAHKDGLYIGRGTKEILFASKLPSSPAEFYLMSYPAHAEFPTAYIRCSETEPTTLGSQKDANKRTIYKYIHPRGVKSCQLVMGLTELEEGSVWNTMPPHTHLRRSEVYMYFNLAPSAMVVHLMGKPDETKHIVMRNKQAVISPSWSIHAGGGTQAYSFIWAMGGENQVFEDIDPVRVEELL
ncbi:MAG: 5-dehydro-4-deoxy-D-glucuronate isomerase [Bacteroidetes bacterium]|nr:MAG: 5-dehydro-4-deoxy-D-glucuronate isomerase [Bacteroidota bacterium]